MIQTFFFAKFVTTFFLNSYAIAVLPDDFQQDKTQYLKLFEELTGAGYKVKHTTVGDAGFTVEISNDE